MSSVAIMTGASQGIGVSPAAKWMTGTSVRMDGGEIKGI
jgi:hypothetical protein